MRKSNILPYVLLSIALLFPLCMSGCQSDMPNKSTQTHSIDNTTEKATEPIMNESTTKSTEKTDVPLDPIELHANTYHFCQSRENFKRFGRVTELKNGITCDFTASGVEFWGRMQGNVTISLSCDRDTYFTVFVDGVRQEERFYATETTKELIVASSLEVGEHTVRILKQTETQWSLCVLKSVSLEGYLYPAPENREFLIEFIGDSITCGYGNLGNPSTPVAGIASMQDGTQAFAFLTAEALNAEANIVACSGIGIAKGWTDMNELAFYQKTCYYRDKEKNYEGNTRIPNLIVINLGTNDQDRGCEEQAFKDRMREFLTYIREFYGTDVPIVWMYNMMTYGCYTWARPILEEFGGESAGIYSVQLTPNKLGAGNHPELTAHYSASEQLVQFIKEKKLLDKSN